jgi:phosphate transport system ATP-binding protein
MIGIFILYLGEIIEDGPANEVFQNPKDQRTKAYIEGKFLV